MTDDEILAAARKAYREMGVKPVQGRWSRGPSCMCPLMTAIDSLGWESPMRATEASVHLERPLAWVNGAVDAWDINTETVVKKYGPLEEYQDGYAFGLRCREEFADLLAG